MGHQRRLMENVQIIISVSVIMFSTMTDRFFHGMNRKNTRLIDPSGIKSNLVTSRCRRSSTSKSKTNKLFQNSKQLTLRNSLNQSLKMPNSIDKITTKSTNFVPPLPFQQPQPRSRGDHLSKTSVQFAPPMAVKDLHTLLQKHINKQQSSQGVIKQQDEQQCKDKIETQNLYGTIKSFKTKFKQKIQQNALKRYTNVNYMQTKHNTDRVEEEDMRKLLHLMRKGKQTQQSQIPRGSFSNTILNNDLSKLSTKNKTHNDKIKSEKNSELIQFDKKQPVQKKLIEQLKNESKQKKNLTISTTIKEEPISKPSPQKPKIYPTDIEQVSQNTKFQMPDRVYKQNTEKMNQIKFQKDTKKEGKQINLRIDLKKIPQKNEETETKALHQLRAKQQGNNKNKNKLNISDKDSSKSVEIPEIPEEKKIVQPVNQTKQKIQKVANEVKKVKKYATQERQQPNPNKERVSIQEDDIQQIQLGFANPVKQNNIVKDKKPGTQKNNNQKTGINKTNFVKKQKTQDSSKSIQDSKKLKDKSKISANINTQLKEVKKEVAMKQEKQKQFDQDEITQLFEYYLGLIDEIGTFCIDTKQFYEQNKIQVFNQYSLVCFYLWQHLYYLRQNCLDALQKKDTNWYEIPKQAFNHSKLVDYFKKQAANVAKQEKKCQKALIGFHQSAKPYLDQNEKILNQQVKNDNKYEKCLKILHQEFKEIQKAYRRAISSQDPKEELYVERLCCIIQMFCQIKCLNGQQVKDLQQIQAIENLAGHYQNHKHLIVL